MRKPSFDWWVRAWAFERGGWLGRNVLYWWWRVHGVWEHGWGEAEIEWLEIKLLDIETYPQFEDFNAQLIRAIRVSILGQTLA